MIRLSLKLVANLDLELYQIDVRIAFLNRKLEKKIYTEQSAGFIMTCQEHKVYRLLKSIYSLKQSLRNDMLDFIKQLWLIIFP